MKRVHIYSSHVTTGMPIHTLAMYSRDGFKGTACGYMRKNVVMDDDRGSVTCTHCLRLMKKAERQS